MKTQLSRPENSPVRYRRLLTLAILLIAALSALGFRLVDLQVLQHQQFQQEVEGQTHRLIIRQPRRGDIRDCRGNLLARSFFVKTICADPALIGKYHSTLAAALAPLLELPAAELDELLSRSAKTNAAGQAHSNQFQIIKKKVTADAWDKIQQALDRLNFGVDARKPSQAERTYFYALRHKAIFAAPQDEQMRVYPNQTLAAHVLGYMGLDSRTNLPPGMPADVGKDGVELAFNAALSGMAGWRETEMVRNRELVPFRDQDVLPEAGLNVVLTLDAGLQDIVESELAQAMRQHDPTSVSAIVVRPKTGQILALANLPTFDPGHPGSAAPAARRNRAISDMEEPGSTFKIVAVSAALNERLISLDDIFNCENGHFFYGGRMLRDAHPYGLLTAEQIITHSSNIGAAKIGLRLGAPLLYEYIRRFGFGDRTGIDLAGEAAGIVHPIKRWNKLSITRLPMGQEIAVTPLQMVMAMCAVANGGKLMRPYIVDHLEDDNGQVVAQYTPQFLRQVIQPQTARMLVQALKTVVSTNGTAREAHLDHFTVAGKTGTAQKAVRGGYASDQFFSSFIGFFPADDPQLCISVVLDDPKRGHYGGKVAGPVFHNIAERAARYLALRPDVDPTQLASLEPPLNAAAARH